MELPVSLNFHLFLTVDNSFTLVQYTQENKNTLTVSNPEVFLVFGQNNFLYI